MNINLKGVVGKTVAMILFLAMVLQLSVPTTVWADDDPGDPADGTKASNFVIKDNAYMTRLKWEAYSTPKQAVLEFAFSEYDDDDNVIFTRADGQDLVDNGRIQVNGGTVWTWEDAGIDFYNAMTHSSFRTTNAQFIKEFINSDDITIKIIADDDSFCEGTVPNQVSEAEREEFFSLLGEGGGGEGEDEIQIAEDDTMLKDKWGTPRFDIGLKSSGEGLNTEPAIPTDQEDDFAQNTQIEINGKDYGSMKSVGFTGKGWPGANIFRLDGIEELKSIKDVIKDDTLNVKLTMEDGKTLEFSVTNELTEDQKNEIAGSDDEEQGLFQTADVKLVKSGQYDQDSMSGPVMKPQGEVLTAADGSHKLILHFQEAEIMGMTAYTTNLKLGTSADNVGDIPTEFILKSDNSAVCIADIPQLEDPQVYEGHIYSNIMDSPVAVKISNVEGDDTIKEKLDELVAQAKEDLENNSYYPETQEPLDNALEAAVNGTNYAELYVDIVKAMAGLREMEENPFVDGTLFHLEVEDTSVIGSKSLEKWGRVTINEEGQPVLKVKYDAYSDWTGEVFFKDVKVFDKDGAEIPAEYVLNDEKNGTLTFTMPYIPQSGVFKTTLVDGTDREWSSDLKLHYSTVKEGPFSQLLIDAIEKYNKYLKDDFVSYGEMEEIKDDFTSASWDHYSEVLQKCRDDLKNPQLTQEMIDQDIEDLKQAKKDLLYKVKAGSGNVANTGISGINNPNNYYSGGDFFEAPVKVGWAGSSIVFGNGNDVYHVLNNGTVLDEDGNLTQTGKMYILAEDLLVKKPFTDQEVEDADDVVRWKNSMMRAYLNGDFYNDNFSEKEKELIVKTELSTKDVKDSGWALNETGEAVTTEDYVFLPSFPDLKNPSYGFASNDGRDMAFGYALRNINFDYFDTASVTSVKPKGRLGGYYRLNSEELQALPAMYLDTSNVLMTLQADQAIPEGLQKATKTDSNIWKLVVLDDSKTMTVEPAKKVGSQKFSVDYTATNANGNMVYAMVVHDGDYKDGKTVAFGKVGQAAANGKVEVTLDDFDEEKDTLYLFEMNESEGTSYASQPMEVEVDFSQEEPEETNYPFISGDDQKMIEGAKSIEELRIDADFDQFESVWVDEQELVRNTDYTARSGSTIIAFSEDYLKSLSPGNHNIKVLFKNNGMATTGLTVTAKEDLADGNYVVDTTILKENVDEPSMSNVMFAREADVVIKGDQAEIKFYIAYPVPKFAHQGQDGTLKNMFIMYQGQKYNGVSDITTKPFKPMRETNPAFGLEEGKAVPTQIITFTLPKEALKEAVLPAGAYVNVGMHIDVNFRVQLDNFRAGASADGDDVLTGNTGSTSGTHSGTTPMTNGVSGTNPMAPATGDESPIGLLMLLALAGLIGITTLTIKKKDLQ